MNHQRNPTIRPLFGTILVLLLGYFDWTLYQKLQVARVFESGEITRQRMDAQLAIVSHAADVAEAKADALAAPPAKGAEAARLSPIAQETQRLAAGVRSDLIGAWIDRVYGPFFKTLALSPADLERFKGLIREKRQSMLDAISAVEAQEAAAGKAVARGLLQNAIRSAVEPINTAIADLLGPLDYASFRQYQGSLPARSTLDQLSAALPDADRLSPTQSAALIAAIERSESPAERTTFAADNLLLSIPAPVRPEVLATADSVLTPAQRTALHRLADQQNLQRDLIRMLYPAP